MLLLVINIIVSIAVDDSMLPWPTLTEYNNHCLLFLKLLGNGVFYTWNRMTCLFHTLTVYWLSCTIHPGSNVMKTYTTPLRVWCVVERPQKLYNSLSSWGWFKGISFAIIQQLEESYILPLPIPPTSSTILFVNNSVQFEKHTAMHDKCRKT